ncbi:hypothetical protein GQ53DRAFT_261853 [Thozetella sp. PMI_491]|nr:hypothetical protein GQ53DRAFT_261853 [Thozetella sp. PMI_491]
MHRRWGIPPSALDLHRRHAAGGAPYVAPTVVAFGPVTKPYRKLLHKTAFSSRETERLVSTGDEPPGKGFRHRLVLDCMNSISPLGATLQSNVVPCQSRAGNSGLHIREMRSDGGYSKFRSRPLRPSPSSPLLVEATQQPAERHRPCRVAHGGRSVFKQRRSEGWISRWPPRIAKTQIEFGSFQMTARRFLRLALRLESLPKLCHGRWP